jgi:PHD/YefM family antitoxin component YafN of YafNO toxin-antitoxin module
MSEQTIAVIPIEEFRLTQSISEMVAHTHRGLYVTQEGIAQFVVLPVERYERMRQQQQRLLLREQYIRLLVDQGYSSADLQSLLSQLDASDEFWLTAPASAQANLLRDSQASFHRYLREQGMNGESLDEEAVDELVDDLIQQVRQENHAA